MPCSSIRKLAAVLIPAVTASVALAGGPTIYVDINATGPMHDGSSWCSAYRDLNDALIAVDESGTTILVADGAYVPSSIGLGNPREATFELLAPATIRGGYAGCGAADPLEHDPEQHPTILSGDLDGNDHTGPFTKAGNACHVVTLIDPTGIGHRIEYLTITAGNANAECGTRSAEGGGFLCVNAQVTFLQVEFVGNLAYFGGAAYLDGCRATFDSCQFAKNGAILGGGVLDTGTVSGLQVSSCAFRGNFATGEGGGLYILGFDSSIEAPLLFNSVFEMNTATNEGGAIYSFFRDLDVQSSTIVENVSANHEGGGIYTFGASARLLNSIVWANAGSLGRTELAQIFPNASRRSALDLRRLGDGVDPIVEYSCVEGWSGTFSGVGSFGEDPRFVPGPVGCYYLDPGEIEVVPPSPCVDAGSDTAPALGLDVLTTAPTEVFDVSKVDVGAHFPVTGTSVVLADNDRNRRVDLADMAAFQNCYLQIPLEDASICCRIFDANSDGELELIDYEIFTLDGPG